VPQIGLQGAGIVPFVRQGEAAGVSHHVGMSLEIEPSGLSGALHHAGKAGGGEWRAALGREHEGRRWVLLALKLPQRPHFVAADRVRRRCIRIYI
jgi:hypothetical protein